MFKTHCAASAEGASIGRALGRIPSGLFVLSVGESLNVHAMLVSWVQQVGFEPPAICLALAKDRPMLAAVRRLGIFGLSILGKSQSGLFKRYARPMPAGVDPFDGVSIHRTPGDQCVLTEAVAWLECGVLQICDFNGDHELVLAQVNAGSVGTDEPTFTHLRGNGLHY